MTAFLYDMIGIVANYFVSYKRCQRRVAVSFTLELNEGHKVK